MQNKNSNSLFGIDINEYTKDVNFNILARNLDFLYLRSSGSGSGRFRVDKKFLEYAKKSREYGIPVGAYHYAMPSWDLNTADLQCDDFLMILQEGFGAKDYGDLFPTLDVEAPTDKSLTTDILIKWIDRFRKRFEKKSRRRLMLYTGAFFIDLYNNFQTSNKEYPLKSMPLWIAMYTKYPDNPPYPKDQGGWTRWRIWQFSENLNVEGVGNPVDANWGPNNIDLLTQPKVLEGFRGIDEGNRIILKWDRNSDIDLLGYNIFANNYWIGTVGDDDTEFVIEKHILNVPDKSTVKITIEAFDYDGETSKRRAAIELKI